MLEARVKYFSVTPIRTSTRTKLSLVWLASPHPSLFSLPRANRALERRLAAVTNTSVLDAFEVGVCDLMGFDDIVIHAFMFSCLSVFVVLTSLT